ncbi:unnamed protein product [Urochloa decumbens]|uniref:Cytochrome P450 n=1 Tax=Urochloa decumbens TaxID=240449 RepID=A0ABC8XEY6_9POAL
MDVKLLYQPLLLSILAIALIRIIRPFLTSPQKARLPPGPWKLPVIGSMHHLVNVLPHRALRDLAGVHGPLMMLQLGETPLVVASSREMARQVLKTHDANFATRPKLLGTEVVLYGSSDIVFSPSGEYWRKLRQLCAAEILSAKRVLSFRHIREQQMASEVERIRAAGPSTPVDLSTMFHDIANGIVARASFGTALRNTDEFLSALKDGIILTSGFMIPDLFPTWRSALAAVTGMRRAIDGVHRTVDSTLDGIIRERKRIRSSGEENLVDVLIGLQERGGLGFDLSEETIKAVIFDMLTAGTGTLASALSWGMSELVRHETAMRKLQAEIRAAFRGKATVTEADLQLQSQSSNLPYLRLVIKETLRLHPPAPLLVPRESIAECEIEGYMIPARSRVIVNAWAIGRDPECWGDDACEFRPERFEGSGIEFNGASFELLPFGAGRRMCPGIAYGIPILEMALVQLLYHFDWSLPDGVAEVDMEEAPGLGVRRKSPLLLCATPFVTM